MATAADISRPRPVRRPWLGSLRDRIAASDPAFSRLRLAARAMLSLALAAIVLAAVSWLVRPLPISAYGLAVVTAFVGSMAVRDASAAKQAATRVIAGLVALAAVFLASVLAPIPLVADVAFLAVIFAAVYVRKFGPRWFAIGMMAFMAYFIGDYLRPQPADIGWIAVAVAIALLATHAISSLVLADDPERDFRRAMVAIDHRINLILRELLRSAPAGDRRALQDHLARLRDAVLMAEGFIPQGENGSLAAEGAASDLAIAVFELQLAVERLVGASYVAAPDRGALSAALYRDQRRPPWATAATDAAATDEAVATRLAGRVQRARAKLDAALGPAPSPAFAAPVVAAASAAGGGGPANAASSSWVPFELQAPIQVTLACAIALGCGVLLSPVRWYWAVITAFIVFNNARSRADTAVRALQRSAGTFAGLIAGTAVATLLQGQMIVSIVGILVLFFLAFYFVQVSYSVMIFLVTIALALLYGVMGMFTPELLLLRLEETLVGGLAGAAVAFVVFPARTSVGAADALDKYFAALTELVAAGERRAHGSEPPADLLALSRTLDRRYADLAAAVRPIGGPWGVVTRFGEVREKLLLLVASAHWGRVFARSLGADRPVEPATAGRIDAAAADLTAHIAAAATKRDSFFERPRSNEASLLAHTPWPALAISEDENPAFALEVISALIGRAAA